MQRKIPVRSILFLSLIQIGLLLLLLAWWGPFYRFLLPAAVLGQADMFIQKFQITCQEFCCLCLCANSSAGNHLEMMHWFQFRTVFAFIAVYYGFAQRVF